jgi:hypothetical protein
MIRRQKQWRLTINGNGRGNFHDFPPSLAEIFPSNRFVVYLQARSDRIHNQQAWLWKYRKRSNVWTASWLTLMDKIKISTMQNIVYHCRRRFSPWELHTCEEMYFDVGSRYGTGSLFWPGDPMTWWPGSMFGGQSRYLMKGNYNKFRLVFAERGRWPTIIYIMILYLEKRWICARVL